MLKNFEDTKNQLKELADVVNAFKSEAVQLRIVELVFGGRATGETEEVSPPPPQSGRRRRRRVRTVAHEKTSGDEAKAKRTRVSSRPGGKTTLDRLHGEGFFKKPRTIGDLVHHADANMAVKLKQSDFSGPLARYVRDGKLKRSKNADNQYEYVQA